MDGLYSRPERILIFSDGEKYDLDDQNDGMKKRLKYYGVIKTVDKRHCLALR